MLATFLLSNNCVIKPKIFLRRLIVIAYCSVVVTNSVSIVLLENYIIRKLPNKSKVAHVLHILRASVAWCKFQICVKMVEKIVCFVYVKISVLLKKRVGKMLKMWWIETSVCLFSYSGDFQNGKIERKFRDLLFFFPLV